MLREDSWIKQQFQNETPLIEPFLEHSISNVNGKKVLSYGLSSFGYDLRLSEKDFRIYTGRTVDPKEVGKESLAAMPLKRSRHGESFFVMPPCSYGLGVSLERIALPRNVTGIAIGKSTYARSGIVCNTTPLECGWEGYLTIELFNATLGDRIIYAREGICQLLFFEGNSCDQSYSEKGGVYDRQAQEVTLPP